jgi:hypothetical protein
VVLVVVAMVAFVVPVLVTTLLAVLDNPSMTEALVRIIDALRGRPPARTPKRPRRPKDPTGR